MTTLKEQIAALPEKMTEEMRDALWEAITKHGSANLEYWIDDLYRDFLAICALTSTPPMVERDAERYRELRGFGTPGMCIRILGVPSYINHSESEVDVAVDSFIRELKAKPAAPVGLTREEEIADAADALAGAFTGAEVFASIMAPWPCSRSAVPSGEYKPEHRTIIGHNGRVTGVEWVNAKDRPPVAAPSGEVAVEVRRNRVWIVKGVQSFMLAYEADTDEELNWYADKLRTVLTGITPAVKSGEVAAGDEQISQIVANWDWAQEKKGYHVTDRDKRIFEQGVRAMARCTPPAPQAATVEQKPVAHVRSMHGDPEAFGEREIVAVDDSMIQKLPYDTALYTIPAPGSEKLEDRYFPFEFEVWQGDGPVAATSGPREQALREIWHYAAQYEQDGPVRVFEVIRKIVPADAKAAP